MDMQILLEDLGTSWGCFRDIGLNTLRLMKHGRTKSFQVNSVWNPFMLASPLDSCGSALIFLSSLHGLAFGSRKLFAMRCRRFWFNM